ncbi:hypothetical protein REPUB_Repub12eG0146900 [Reevesia pubescens]
MVGRETKFGGSVFSWADEVEKEDEEEAAAATIGAGGSQAQVHQYKKRPNPFGSARPREVALQEKGIDWTTLDLHLQQPSPSTSRHESQNEKLWKQSNPQPTITILNSKQPDPVRFRGCPAVSSHSQVILTPQIRSSILLVPPLRYPPKYVAGVLFEPGVSNTLNALDSGYQHFKLEKENRFQEGRKFHSLKSESEMCGNRRRTTSDLVQAKEAQQKGRNRILGESVVYGHNPEADSATRKEKFHSRNALGLPLVNQIIGPPEMQYKRMPSNRKQRRNVQCKRMPSNGKQRRNVQDDWEWQKITRKVQDLSVRQGYNGGRDAAHRQIKGERAGLGRNNKNNFEKKQINKKT